jgi:hypothetical protein
MGLASSSFIKIISGIIHCNDYRVRIAQGGKALLTMKYETVIMLMTTIDSLHLFLMLLTNVHYLQNVVVGCKGQRPNI